MATLKEAIAGSPRVGEVVASHLFAVTDPAGAQIYSASAGQVAENVITALPPNPAEPLCDGASGLAAHKIPVTVASDGVSVALVVNPGGVEDSTAMLGGEWRSIPADTVVDLDAGTDTVPATNRVYAMWVDPAVVVSATTGGWPTGEHLRIAEVSILTAAAVQADPDRGILHVSEADGYLCNGGNGLDAVLPEAITSIPPRWQSGGAVTVDPLTGTELGVAITGTEVVRVRRLTADPKAAPSRMLIPGDGYASVTNLADAATTAAGDPLAVNDYLGLVIGIAPGQDGSADHVWISKPTDAYGSEAAARADTNRTADTRIPLIWRDSGVLLARVVVKRLPGGAGYEAVTIQDLRGLQPGSAASSVASAETAVFFDGNFRVVSSEAPAVELQFDLGDMTASGTVGVPDLYAGAVLGVKVPIGATAGPGQQGWWSSDPSRLLVWEPGANGGVGGWLQAALTAA